MELLRITVYFLSFLLANIDYYLCLFLPHTPSDFTQSSTNHHTNTSYLLQTSIPFHLNTLLNFIPPLARGLLISNHNFQHFVYLFWLCNKGDFLQSWIIEMKFWIKKDSVFIFVCSLIITLFPSISAYSARFLFF